MFMQGLDWFEPAGYLHGLRQQFQSVHRRGIVEAARLGEPDSREENRAGKVAVGKSSEEAARFETHALPTGFTEISQP
jgi:hypothetical protein